MDHEQGLARLAEGPLNGIGAAPWHAGPLPASGRHEARTHDVGKVSFEPVADLTVAVHHEQLISTVRLWPQYPWARHIRAQVAKNGLRGVE